MKSAQTLTLPNPNANPHFNPKHAEVFPIFTLAGTHWLALKAAVRVNETFSYLLTGWTFKMKYVKTTYFFCFEFENRKSVDRLRQTPYLLHPQGGNVEKVWD